MRNFHQGLLAIVAAILMAAPAPAQEGQTMYDQAGKFYAEKTWDRAIELYTRFVTENPGDERVPQAEYNILRSRYALRKFEDFEADTVAFLAKHRGTRLAAEAGSLLATYLYQRQRWSNWERIGQLHEQALRDFRNSIGRRPMDPAETRRYAQLLMAAAGFYQDWYDDRALPLAEKHYRAVIDLAIDDDWTGNAWYSLGQFYGRRLSDEAKMSAAWLRVVKDYPKAAVADQALFALARWDASHARYVQARARYLELRRQYPQSSLEQRALEAVKEIERPQFQMRISETHLPGAKIPTRLYSRNLKGITLTAWHIDAATLEALLRAPEDDRQGDNDDEPGQEAVLRKGRKVTSWHVDAVDNGDYQFWSSGRLDSPLREPGFYIIKAVADGHPKLVNYAEINITSLVLAQQYAAGEMVNYVASRATRQPVAGARLTVVDTDPEKPVTVGTGSTDADGLWSLKVADPKTSRSLTTFGEYRGELILPDSMYLGWRDRERTLDGYLYTDRPVYRPGNEVQYKAILRYLEAGEFANLPEEKVTVTINDARGEEKAKQELTTDAYGTVNGSLTLPDDPTLGVWSITVRVPGEGSVNGQFRVEEYRKPEFTVAVGQPLSEVRPGRGAAVPIDVKYYFGAPVGEAEVRYVVQRQPYYHRTWWFQPWDWFYASFRDDVRRRPWGWNRTVITEGVVQTDADGRAVVEFPTTDDSEDYTYSVEVQVTDITRRVIAESGSFTVTQKGFFLSAEAGQGLYRPTDRVTLTVKAENADRQPLEKPVSVDLWRLVWVPEVRDAKTDKITTHAHWQREARAWDAPKQVVTDPATGQRPLIFDAPGDGYYEAELSSPDSFDPQAQVTGTVRFWVASDAWKGRNWDIANLQLVPEKALYERGETARILVNSPVPDGALLLTVGADRIFETKVIKLTGASQVIELPMLNQYSPNVYLQALVVGFREVYLADTELLVPPTDELLNITIASDQAEYKPRTTGTFTIKTTDHRGEPVRTQVSLGITDESVYAIQEEFVQPIGAYFYGRKRSNDIRQRLSFERWGEYDEEITAEDVLAAQALRSDRDAAMEAAPAAMPAPSPGAPQREVAKMAGGGGASPEEPIAIREFFPDTIRWLPAVETDAQGVATVTVDFPDSLTTWRATARAITTGTKVGQQVSSVITTKDLITRLQAPRFFTQLDEATISLVVTNQTALQQQVAVGFQIEGLELAGNPQDSVVLPPNGQVRVDRIVRATTPGTATITVTARGPNDSDGLKLTYPVLPHGADKFATAAGRVTDGKATLTLDLPADRREDATGLSFTLSPTLGATLLDALPYLADYPYGCVEQTTSRFIPAVLVARTLGLTGGQGGGGVPQPGQVPASWQRRGLEALPEMVQQGLQRLVTAQGEDGGWGWFPGMGSSVYMTSYVTYGLVQARLADYAVPARVLDQATRFLVSRLHLLSRQIDGLAYTAWVLSEALEGGVLKLGGDDEKALNDAVERVYAEREDLNDYTRALLVLTLSNRGDAERAGVVWRNLQARRIETEHGVHWGKSRWGWRWSEDQVETTAFSLLAMLRVEPDSPLTTKAVQWLVMNRTGTRWYSTKDTATAIYALTAFADETGELEASYTATLTVNGQPVKTWEVTRDNALTLDGQIEVDPSLLKTGANTLELTQDGKGSAWYSALLTYYTTEDPITAASSYLSADRKYYRVVTRTDDKQRRRTELVPLGDGEALLSGEEIEVEITIEAENDFDYVAFSDPKPAGCEPVDQTSGGTWGGSYMYRELHDTEVTFFADHIRQGKTRITYRLRAESPGVFRALPHSGFSMYRPDVRCLSNEDIVRINDRPAATP